MSKILFSSFMLALSVVMLVVCFMNSWVIALVFNSISSTIWAVVFYIAVDEYIILKRLKKMISTN